MALLGQTLPNSKLMEDLPDHDSWKNWFQIFGPKLLLCARQWTHSLAREDIPVRLFDFWVASDSLTPVSSAWHYVLGTERWLTP